MKKTSLSILGVVLIGMVVLLGAAIFPGSRAVALVVEKDLEQLTHEADLIVIGKVKSIESRWNEERSLIYTYVTICVSEYIKNSLGVEESKENGDQEIVVRILGGEVGDMKLTVSDTPDFRKDEEVFVFLRIGKSGNQDSFLPMKPDESSRTERKEELLPLRINEETFLWVGGAVQGKYTIENGRAKNEVLGFVVPLDDLTSQVKMIVDERESQ